MDQSDLVLVGFFSMLGALSNYTNTIVTALYFLRFQAFGGMSVIGQVPDLKFLDRLRIFWRHLSSCVDWIFRVSFSETVQMRSQEKCTVILMSYRRPFNMDWQVRSVLKCDFVERVIVCNNNPKERIRDWVRVTDPRLNLIDRLSETGPGIRIKLAAESQGKFFISFDDDVFHLPLQLATLFTALLKNPRRIYGTEGELLPKGSALEMVSGVYPFQCGIRGRSRQVSAVTQGYAFTLEQSQRCLALMKDLDMPEPEGVYNGEDIVLSWSGRLPPKLVNIGSYLDCISSFSPGIALHQSTDFFERRVELYLGLIKRGLFKVFTGSHCDSHHR